MDELEKALNQVVAEQLRADAAEKALADLKASADKTAGELTGLQGRFDALQKERGDVDVDKLKRSVEVLQRQVAAERKARTDAESPENIRAKVKARVALERQAIGIVPDARFDEMTDRDVMTVVIERLDGPVNPERSNAFVEGQFATLVKGHAQGEAAIASVREKIEESTQKARVDGPAKSPRQVYLDRMANAWNQKESR